MTIIIHTRIYMVTWNHGDLWKDGVHLLELGKTKLAQNFICLLSNFLNLHTLNHQTQKTVNQSQHKVF